MTVCDLGCASSIVRAERFRTVAKSFTAGAHTPADMGGHQIEFRDADSRPYRVVLRVSGPPRALEGDRTWLICR
jgi:hypothetical protein